MKSLNHLFKLQAYVWANSKWVDRTQVNVPGKPKIYDTVLIPDIIGHVDVGDESVGDNYTMLVTVLVTNIHVCFYISVGRQHSKDSINIEILSPTSKNRHQL